ncbi:MAG: hypothetical protein ABIR79_01220 [Candidatus Binatia bacterium]
MMRRRASALVALAAIATYLALGWHHLALPGLQYDEVADAVPAAEVLRGEMPPAAAPGRCCCSWASRS